MFVQNLINSVFRIRRIGRQRDEFLRAPVNLAALVVHDAAAQRLVGSFLLTGPDTGVHVQAAGVSLFTILGIHQLPHHLRDVFRVDFGGIGVGADFQLLFLGGFGFVGGDKAILQHAVNDVELARTGALGVADRVVGRRCLRQACQHGGFGDGDGF